MSSILTKFTIKVGDLTPGLQAQLVDGKGAAIDLTGASSIAFKMVCVTTGVTKTVTGDAQFDDLTNGKVRYLWKAGDTDTVGLYEGEFTVTWLTKPETFPSDGYIPIEVEAKT